MGAIEGFKPKSIIIILIVLFATIGCIICTFIINNNIIQFSSLPKDITIKVRDGALGSKDSVIFNLPVKSKIPLASYNPGSVELSTKVERNMLYHQNSFFPVWGMLILIMITVASGSVPAFIAQIIYMKNSFELNKNQIIYSLLYAILILFFLAVSNSAGKGYYTPQKIIDDFHILLTSGKIIEGIVLATILLMIPVLTLVFLIGPASDTLFKSEITKINFKKAAQSLNQLNQQLRSALQILAIIVVFSVLTSSALRESIKATIEIGGYNIFPTEVSFVYGMYFSLFLCITYIPVHYYLSQQYNYLKSLSFDSEDLDKEKEAVLSLYNLKSSALDNIKMALTVLAPLLSSFLPENLHFLK